MLLSPAYRLVVGGREVDTTVEPRASTVDQLSVDVGFEDPADSLVVRLGNVGGLRPEVGDEVAVELGYLEEEGGLTLVFTGSVTDVNPSLPHTVVVARSPASRLLGTRVDQSFENKSAADIVRELASRAEVTAARVDSGPVFPLYVVDGRRAAYRHVHDLGRLSGCDVCFDPRGQLLFQRRGSGGAQHVFEYGKHIIEVEAHRQTGPASIEVFGESPGTSRGSNSWSWLTKDFSASKGRAGSGQPVRLLEHSALRTRELAQAAADAALSALGADSVRGRLLTFGNPNVFPGDLLRVQGVPDARVDGDFRVRAVRHRLTKARGFTTSIEFRGTA